MTDQIDPQVTAALVTMSGTLLGGGVLGRWWGRRTRTGQDQRCERICASMVSAMEGVLDCMEAIGANHPVLSPVIFKARVQIDHAREYLNGEVA